jgi:hypothetical protein
MISINYYHHVHVYENCQNLDYGNGDGSMTYDVGQAQGCDYETCELTLANVRMHGQKHDVKCGCVYCTVMFMITRHFNVMYSMYVSYYNDYYKYWRHRFKVGAH